MVKPSWRELPASADGLLPPLLRLLEPDLDDATIVARLAAMREQPGFRLLGGLCDGELVAVAGLSPRTHLYSGRTCFVENVVIRPDFRDRGIGRALMAEIESRARADGARMLTLDAYAVNHAARAFYERLGYDPRGVHFVKEI